MVSVDRKKTVETIESQTQAESLYSDLPNNTNHPSDVWSKDLLVRMAAHADTQAEAEAASQGDETAETVNGGRPVNRESMVDQSHIAEKHAIENEVNGTPVATATIVDDPGQTPNEDRAKHTSFVEMEYKGKRKVPRSHAEMFTVTEIMQKQLLQQVQCL